LIPFCLTVGPFNKAYDISSFDLDIYHLESFDSNLIQVTYKLSDTGQLTNSDDIFKWTVAKSDKSEHYYCTFFFNFDKLNNSEKIRLGHDFKIRVELAGKKFHFWLNSESLRHRDLPALYEDRTFTLDQHLDDHELMLAVMPRNVNVDFEKRQEMFNAKRRNNGRFKVAEQSDVDRRLSDLCAVAKEIMQNVADMEEEVFEEL